MRRAFHIFIQIWCSCPVGSCRGPPRRAGSQAGPRWAGRTGVSRTVGLVSESGVERPGVGIGAPRWLRTLNSRLSGVERRGEYRLDGIMRAQAGFGRVLLARSPRRTKTAYVRRLCRLAIVRQVAAGKGVSIGEHMPARRALFFWCFMPQTGAVLGSLIICKQQSAL